MAAKDLMSWSAGRWHKKVPVEFREAAGFNHATVSPKQLNAPPTKEGSRAAANAWYQAQVTQWQAINLARKPKEPAYFEKVRTARVDWLRVNGDHEQAQELAAKSDADMQADLVEKLAEQILAHWKGEKGTTPGMVEEQIWSDRLSRKTEPTNRTIKESVQQFLDVKKAESKAGELSLRRIENIRFQLTYFQTWAGADTSIDTINAGTVTSYRTWLLGEDLAKTYKSEVFSTFKRWVNFLAMHDLILLPKNLHDSKIGTVDKSIHPADVDEPIFTAAECHTLLNAATERTQLYILLAMNCGFYQKEISDLRRSEFNAEKGTITCKRNKTMHKSNRVPLVTYKLWGRTLHLLRQHMATEGNLLLVTDEGKPLVPEGTGRTDCVNSAYVRLQNKLKIKNGDRKSFGVLRDTGSTWLRNHPEYERVQEEWLGHAPSSIAKRHYDKTPRAVKEVRLDDAIAWLGKQYGIE